MDITSFVVSRRNDALLLGDYNAYRTQLSRRILTLCRKLGRTSAKGRKYTPKTPVTAQDVARDPEFVRLLLLTSERAWAHAMDMRSTHSAETSGKAITGSARRHIISRLNKASSNARQIVQLLEDESVTGASTEDILEVKAYSSTLAGSVEFEKRGWEKSLKYHAEARLIYTALFTSTRNEVLKDVLDNTIDPSIRYAAYQLRLPRSLTVPVVARRYFPRSDARLMRELERLDPSILRDETSGSTKASAREDHHLPKTITWRSRTVNIEHSSISQALASVSAAQEQLSKLLSEVPGRERSPKDNAAAYDEVLIPSQDAVDATKSAIDQLASEGVGPGDKRMQALQVTKTAVNYALVEWRIGRNRVLCGREDGAVFEAEVAQKVRKPRKDGTEWTRREEGSGRSLARLKERVVLYDATLQSLDSIKELPGVAADTAFMAELEGTRVYFQSLKCLSIARGHSLLSNHRAALALLTRALDLAARAVSAASPVSSRSTKEMPRSDVSPEHARSLRQVLDGLVSQHRALVELNDESVKPAAAERNKVTEAAPLIERLDEYPSTCVDLTRLVTYPPKLEPIPVKPLFFDIAWNYIEYPGRPAQALQSGRKVAVDGDQGKVTEKKEAKKGWFGFGRG